MSSLCYSSSGRLAKEISVFRGKFRLFDSFSSLKVYLWEDLLKQSYQSDAKAKHTVSSWNAVPLHRGCWSSIRLDPSSSNNDEIEPKDSCGDDHGMSGTWVYAHCWSNVGSPATHGWFDLIGAAAKVFYVFLFAFYVCLCGGLILRNQTSISSETSGYPFIGEPVSPVQVL